MEPTVVSLVALACILAATFLGFALRTILPEHHMKPDSKDVIKMGTGVIATMAALVLGLMIASAQGTFNSLNGELRQMASEIVVLDRTMALYGPETEEARDILRRGLTDAIDTVWSVRGNSIAVGKLDRSSYGIRDLEEKLLRLAPKNGFQAKLQSQAIQSSDQIATAVSQVIQQSGQTSIPRPFLVLLICWLAILFFCFGLFSSPNATVIAVLMVCALSASSAIFLILELDQPYGGLIAVSNAPLLKALSIIGRP